MIFQFSLLLFFQLEPSTRPVGAGPEEAHKNDQWGGTTLLCEKPHRVGVVQPGEEEDPRRHHCSLSKLKLLSRAYYYKAMVFN